MGLLERIFGRKVELEPEPAPAGVPRRDAAAVERYEQLLRTAPHDVLEQAHVEAFEQLTPAQLDLLYERLTATATTDDERPADARPESLAHSAARAERRRPGTIAQTLDETEARAETNAVVGYSILDAVIWYSLASVAWNTWSLPPDDTTDAPPPDEFDAGGSFDLGL
ncbi:MULTISPECIES: hypothetical protein [unclassified Agromyces]|uniref:hypothetical protein n=1 Tax=unclassified Agromyces TaxID=2639701 RepID=UPI00301516A6